MKVPLFPHGEAAAGLLPVRVLEKPGVYKLEFLNQAGAVIHTTSVTVLDAHYPRQNIVISKELSELKASPGESESMAAFRKQISAVQQWREPFQLPVAGCMTSLFGVLRYHNGKPTGDFHGGIDQRSPQGAPIRAITAGTIVVAQQFNLRGGTVGIDHGQGLESVYMHMSKVIAVEGQRVKAGDVIGQIGSTGRSTGPHLHWSLYAFGEPVNPAQWTKPESCTPAKKHRTKI